MDKPKKGYQALGDEAKVEVQAMEPDNAAREALRRLGKGMCPQGVSYLGSVALHIYAATADNPLSPPGAAYITQISVGEATEAVTVVGMQELGKRVMAVYRGEKKSIDPNYTVDL